LCDDIIVLKDVCLKHKRSPTWQKETQALTREKNPLTLIASPVATVDIAALKEIEGSLEKMRGLNPDIIKAFKAISAGRKVLRLKEAVKMQTGEKPGYHALMVGNPGVGKTTVARFYAQWLKANGALSKGHLVETDRSGLVGTHIGKTEAKTAEVLQSAQGGVLFIDEAPSLYKESSNDYGLIALAQIMKHMEDQRADFAVIMAGPPQGVQKLLDMTSGLRSRFSLTLNFPDYPNDILTHIAHDKLAARDLTPCAEFDRILEAIINDLRGRDRQNFGNGRFVRDFVEALEGEVSQRLDNEGKLDPLLTKKTEPPSAEAVKTLLTVTTEDLWAIAERECNLPRHKIGILGHTPAPTPPSPPGTVITGLFEKRPPS
jgi:stage V sporulation protein K